MRQIIYSAIPEIPLIIPGDDLTGIILKALSNTKISVQKDDIFVIAQKIVSKAENRLVNLTDVSPSKIAIDLAKLTEKDPRFVELVLRESTSVLRHRSGALIVEHRLGFICANAGIDHSNVEGPSGSDEDWVLLLPENPDKSAAEIRKGIMKETGVNVGVMIIDSHGRAWRNGIVGVCIGVSGLPAIVDKRGQPDLFGYRLRITQIAAADELAAGASLLMGQADEASPVIHVRGFPYPLRESGLHELIRPKAMDLFR
jgi:coenzyme F420-0:L-glutamate ligase/coenzyme F420-1:gamma-L-glutamate ligase